MSTVIIPELSVKNKYWISKHRYYELKHFCLQYPEWKQSVLYLETRNFPGGSFIKTSGRGDRKPTEELALERLWYNERINLVDKSLGGKTPDGSYEFDPHCHSFFFFSPHLQSLL